MIITDDQVESDFYNSLLLAGVEEKNIYSFNELTNTNIERDLLNEVENNQIDTDLLYVLFTSGSTGEPKELALPIVRLLIIPIGIQLHSGLIVVQSMVHKHRFSSICQFQSCIQH